MGLAMNAFKDRVLPKCPASEWKPDMDPKVDPASSSLVPWIETRILTWLKEKNSSLEQEERRVFRASLATKQAMEGRTRVDKIVNAGLDNS